MHDVVPGSSHSWCGLVDLRSRLVRFRSVDLLASFHLSPMNNQMQFSIGLSNYATLTAVSTAVANSVTSAPATFDAMKELATALNSAPNFRCSTRPGSDSGILWR